MKKLLYAVALACALLSTPAAAQIVSYTSMSPEGARITVPGIQASGSKKVSISTATTTEVIALVTGKPIYITSFGIHSAGTTTTKFVYGTGTNCGTGTTDLTDVFDLTASDGMVLGNGTGMVLYVPPGNAFCVTNTAAVHVGGSVSYAQF